VAVAETATHRRLRTFGLRRAVLLGSAAVLVMVGLAPASAAPARSAQPFELKLINGLGAGEPQVAVDPVHHTVVVSFLLSNPTEKISKCGIATSRDRGQTWQVRYKSPADPIRSSNVSCSDPVAATGKDGAMYVGAMFQADSLDTFVSGSTDGGKTWGPSVYSTGNSATVDNIQAAPNTGLDDRPWLTADNRTGAVYASMADFVPRLRRWVVASRDGGRTFGPPRAIASNAAPEFPAGDYIPSAANGVLAVSYVTVALDPDCLCRNVFETSTDDGVTWTRHPAPIPAQWTAADPSHPGRFAIMSGGQDITDWQSFNPNELLVSVTSDYGKTWSPPAAIGEDPPNPRWMPWIAYSPTGILGVSYRTKYGTRSCLTPHDCTNTSYDEWAAVSSDGGLHFDRPVRISHAPSAAQIDSGTGFAAGDDFGTVALDEKYLYVAWGDMRKNPGSSASGAQRSLYFGRVRLQGAR
jgi:hypothetical protein